MPLEVAIVILEEDSSGDIRWLEAEAHTNVA
jgi:hypothetical protein